jgi:phage terminase large subunit
MKIKLKGLSKRIGKIYKEYLWGNEHYYQIYFGGSSSGKSYSVVQMLVLDCLKGRNILALRKVGATINKSLFNEVLEKINGLKLRQYFHINKSNYEITCRLKGSQILFAGADDTEKLKSIRSRIGVIDTILMEEATEFTYKDFKTIIKRLRGTSKFKKRIILLFNPVLKTHWIFKQFFSIWRDNGEKYFEDETTSILKTTYLDNTFLEPEDIKQLEDETDPYYHDVYTLGNWGVMGGLIFNNWKVQDFDKESFGNYRHGVDWGFSDDPFSYVRLAIDKKRKIIHICDTIYKVGMLNSESAPHVKKILKQDVVYCDSAEPKSVAEYKTLGINAKSADKGQGSIETGIKFLQDYDIIIHSSCRAVINEFQSYKWLEDRKTGDMLPKPEDKNNHTIDAIRYAVCKDSAHKKQARIIRL